MPSNCMYGMVPVDGRNVNPNFTLYIVLPERSISMLLSPRLPANINGIYRHNTMLPWIWFSAAQPLFILDGVEPRRAARL